MHDFKTVIQRIILFIGSVAIFFAGTFIYGIAVNSSADDIHNFISKNTDLNYDEVHIEIVKDKYQLNLFYENKLIKSYRAVFGNNNTKEEILGNDKTIPNGNYEISGIVTDSKFNKFFKLNYPRVEDFIELYESKFITKIEFLKLTSNDNSHIYKKLFGNVNIGIQGTGNMDFLLSNFPIFFNWTNGSIAVSNSDIDEIYLLINKGTKVVVKN